MLVISVVVKSDVCVTSVVTLDTSVSVVTMVWVTGGIVWVNGGKVWVLMETLPDTLVVVVTIDVDTVPFFEVCGVSSELL